MDLFNSKPFKVAVWILIVFLIVYMGQQVSFIFLPIVIMARLLFIPTLLAIILYYLFNPIVDLLEERKLPRFWSVILIYLAIAVLAVLLLLTIGTTAYQEFVELIDLFPEYIQQLIESVNALENTYFYQRIQQNGGIDLEGLTDAISNALLSALPGVRDSVAAAAAFLANMVLFFALLPILLYYMLKDGAKLHKYVAMRIPDKYQEEAFAVLEEIDKGLGSFIQGQVIIGISVGIMAYIGFLIIGIQHPLILALIAVISNFIPYIGPILGTIPALIVAFVTSTFMGVQVLVLITIIQQIETFFIMPQVMGRKLYAHPLTILVLLLVVSSLFGILGLLFAVPTYIILKIIFDHGYEFVRRKRKKDAQSSVGP